MLDNFVRGNRRNLEQAASLGDLIIIDGDIRDADTVDAAVNGVDYIFHLAALRITRCAEAPKEAVEVLSTECPMCLKAPCAMRLQDHGRLFRLRVWRPFLLADG